MFKVKLLAGLAVGIAVMAMSAAPAGALYRTRNQNKTQGLVTFGTTSFASGSAKVSCETAHGEWQIQTKGQWWEHEQNGKQLKTTNGPHLYIKIYQWNNCTAEVLSMKVPAKVSECIFQLKEEQKLGFVSTADVASECIITIPVSAEIVCLIKVTPGNHSGENEELKSIKGENSGQNVNSTAEVEGIHDKGEEGKKCKVENATNAKFTSAAGALKAEGLEIN